MKSKKILILGATGMLGHVLFSRLSLQRDLDVYATVREAAGLDQWFSPELRQKIITGIDADSFDTIAGAVGDVKPDVAINCVGLVKQLPIADDPQAAIAINALLPHKIAQICGAAGTRLIHIGTDCVFDGTKGNYTENDPSDAKDLYGRSKFLGEVAYPHCITLRTSLIGHELKGKHGLIEWFLSQEEKTRGFTRAIFSGLPTVELARVIAQYVLPDPGLSGVCQVSSAAISKYELLQLVAARYGKTIEIEPDEAVVVDRSLDSSAFRQKTGYRPPAWDELVDGMYRHYMEFGYAKKAKVA